MDGKTANICFTSPPYNAKSAESLSSDGKKDSKYLSHDDNQSDDSYLSLLLEFTNTWLPKTEYLLNNIQMLSGNKKVFIKYLNAYVDHVADLSVWVKTNPQPAMAKNVMNSAFEHIIFLSSTKNPSRAINCANFRGTFSNVYTAPVNSKNKFSDIHSATFSVEFATNYIENLTTRNAIVSDAFGGTGTTLIAAEKVSRQCFMMELEPVYVDLIINRWQDFTGKQAIHIESGKTYEQLKGERL
jgi:DNA modification methylase